MDSVTLRKASPKDSEFAYCAKRAAFREYVEKVLISRPDRRVLRRPEPEPAAFPAAACG